MGEAILRNSENLDLFTWVIIGSVLLQIIAKYAFRFEYQKFLNRDEISSFNRVFIYLIATVCFVSLLALVLFQLLQEKYQEYFSTDWQQYAFCWLMLILLIVAKMIIKLIWFNSYQDFKAFMENIKEKSYLSFWKYLICLVFIVIFYYSPLSTYYREIYGIYLFIGIYLLDFIFEFLFIQKLNFNLVLYKILYLCTLEILPVLVFLKLLFILN